MDQLTFTWNFRVRDVSVGNDLLWKARCGLCGNLQLVFPDFDPDKLNALVVKHESIRIFMAKVVTQQLKVEGADVENDYSYENMDKPIIVKQPTDNPVMQRHPGEVFLNLKSQYGAGKRVKGGVLTYTSGSWTVILVSDRGTNASTFSLVGSNFSFSPFWPTTWISYQTASSSSTNSRINCRPLSL